MSKIKAAKVHKDAIAIRSMAAGCFTWLCDVEHHAEVAGDGAEFFPCLCDCFEDGRPKSYRYRTEPASKKWSAAFKKLRQHASSGRLTVIHHHPEIIDSDGVPGIDLLVCKTPRKRPPQNGTWFPPTAAALDLPSGKLRVSYDDGLLDDSEEWETSVVDLPAGFYTATVFTRVFETEFEAPPRTHVPDLAVFLSPAEKPKRAKLVDTPLVPVLPYGSNIHDVRSSLGL